METTMMMNKDQAWQKAREVDPSLPQTPPPNLNGAGDSLVALAQRLQETETALKEMKTSSWLPIDLIDPKMEATAEFGIVSVSAEFDGARSFIDIRGVHGDTGDEETVRIPLKNPSPSIMRTLKKLEGHRLSKTNRQLVPDMKRLGARVLMLTPYECLMILKQNVNQRPLRISVVQRYVQAHSDGSWLVCNQGIGLDWDGNNIDGQHRAFAVLLTGKAMPVLLVWGLDPAARKVVDDGYGRTPGQVDDMTGGTDGLPSGVTIQKYTNKLYLLHGGTTTKSRLYYESIKNHYLPSLEWIYSYIHPVEPRYPHAKQTVLRSPSVVSAFLLLHQAFTDEAEQFIELVLCPVPKTSDQTILTVRQYLDKRSRRDDAMSKDDYLNQVYKLISGFIAWKKGQNRSHLKPLPTRKSKSRTGALIQQRRDVFYKTLQVLWSQDDLLPEDALKTVGWAPDRKGREVT